MLNYKMCHHGTETVFRNICSFFPGATFFTIFQKGLSADCRQTGGSPGVFVEQTCFFPGEFIEQTFSYYLIKHNNTNFLRNFYYFSPQTHPKFPGASIFVYFPFKQISIFQELLFSHQTDIHFPGSPQTNIIFQETPMPWIDKHFPERYLPSNRYFVNTVGGWHCSWL